MNPKTDSQPKGPTVLLIQYGINPIRLEPVCGNSGKVYGHAHYNPKLVRHEFRMPLDQFQDPKTHRDLFNALRRAGCQWFPLFEVPTDSLSGELETLKAENVALQAEVAALKAELLGDEEAAIAGDPEVSEFDRLHRKGINSLRKMARKAGHPLTGNPSKAALATFILSKQTAPEPAATA